MEATEMEPGAWDECGQALCMNLGGTVLVGAFELQHDIAGAVAFEPFNGGASDVAAQVFEFLPLMGSAADLGMQAKAVLVDTALWRGLRRLVRDGLQAQHLLARPWPERNAVGAGRRLQGPERGIRRGRGKIGHPLLFNFEYQAMQMDVEIGGRAEALNERDGAGGGLGTL